MAKKPGTKSDTGSKGGDLNTFDPARRIIVLYGENDFLRLEFTTHLRESLEQHHGGLDVFSFDGLTASPAEVLDECRSFGLMSSHKVVIVENAADLVKEDARPLFERYAESPNEGTTLVLRGTIWRGGKLDDLIIRHGVIHHCGPLDFAKLAAWTARRAAKRHNATVQPDAARMLVSLLDGHMTRIDTELAKLAAAGAGPDGKATITADLVAAHVGDEREADLWQIQSEFLNPDPRIGLENLRTLLETSREPALKIQWALTDLARKIHAVTAVARQGGNVRAAGSAAKIYGAGAEPIYDLSRRASAEAAADLFQACVRADAASKRGSDPIRSLEALAIRFARFAAHPADHC
ncbi:MAG: DNA polymerase III subunit delta [Phycisphaeraceae bacterium]|nr:DNA polymerase III subunit delta [Phycisphaeraceae bacterium]